MPLDSCVSLVAFVSMISRWIALSACGPDYAFIAVDRCACFVHLGPTGASWVMYEHNMLAAGRRELCSRGGDRLYSIPQIAGGMGNSLGSVELEVVSMMSTTLQTLPNRLFMLRLALDEYVRLVFSAGSLPRAHRAGANNTVRATRSLAFFRQCLPGSVDSNGLLLGYRNGWWTAKYYHCAGRQGVLVRAPLSLAQG